MLMKTDRANVAHYIVNKECHTHTLSAAGLTLYKVHQGVIQLKPQYREHLILSQIEIISYSSFLKLKS